MLSFPLAKDIRPVLAVNIRNYSCQNGELGKYKRHIVGFFLL